MKTIYSYQDDQVRVQVVNYDNFVFKLLVNRRVLYVGDFYSARIRFIATVRDFVTQEKLNI